MKFTEKLLKRSLINDVEIYPNFFSNIWKIPNKNQLFIYILWTDGDIPQYVYDDITERLSDYVIKFVDGKTISEYLLKYKPYSIGYNSHSFDDPLVKALIRNYNNPKLMDILWNITQWVIEGKGTRYLYNKYKYDEDCFPGIDLQRVSGLDRMFKPLKQVAANLRHEKIQDLPIKPGSIIKVDEIANIVVYEMNDIIITEKLLVGIPLHHNSPTVPKTAYRGLLDAIDFRYDIGVKFEVELLNSNNAQIGKVLSDKLYSDISGLDVSEFKDLRTNRETVNYSDIILDTIKFKTPELKLFLENIRSNVFNYTEYKKIPKGADAKKKAFKIDNNLYHDLKLFDNDIIFATGGIHGVHSKFKMLEASEDVELEDIDADSFYPYIYDKFEMSPAHLTHFIHMAKHVIPLRIDYKHKGIKSFANGLKLTINMWFGSANSDFSWLKDEQFLLSVTINGQLLLLMLAEALYLEGINPYYFNTDGLTVSLHPSKRPIMEKVCKQWEIDTRMSLGYDHFEKSYIRDVNNFINIKTSGDIKLKGAYEYTGFIEKYGEFALTGSFDKPIIAYSVVEYFTKGIPIKTTLMNHVKLYPEDGIYDFCVAFKANKQFTNQLFTINASETTVEDLQQSIRYFVSNSNQKLFKVKEKTNRELLGLVKASKDKKSKFNHLFFLSKEKQSSGELIKFIEGYGYIYKISQGLILQPSPKLDKMHYDELEADRNITIFNDYYKSDDYNINYNYYIEEAQKLIDGIEKQEIKRVVNEQQLKLF